MTDINPAAIERMAGRNTLNEDEAETLLILSEALTESNEALAIMAERLDSWINQCAAMEQTIVELRDELAQAKGGVK